MDNEMKLVNCTGKTLHLWGEVDTDVFGIMDIVPVQNEVALPKLETSQEPLWDFDPNENGLAWQAVAIRYRHIENMPPERKNTYYVVSKELAQAAATFHRRFDFLYPDIRYIPPQKRDDIITCVGFIY